jgi:O-antigen/teichoic acid export membrane protein
VRRDSPTTIATVAMKTPRIVIVKNAVWSVGAFGLLQGLRFATSVVLTRLLAPELFGIMVIFNSLKAGIELLTDVGIGQSIIYNRNAETSDFYNTAWTLAAIRGVILWVIACAVTVPVAYHYQTPILYSVIPVAAFILVISGFGSLNGALLQRRLNIPKLTIFEIVATSLYSVGQISLAYFFPTIWALVFGLILGSSISTILGYFIIPETKHKFTINKAYALEILHFGKWIFLGSLVYYLSTTFDRLYLAGVIPLALLGVYGLARSLAEMLSLLAIRLGNSVIFPFIASHAETPRSELRGQVFWLRLNFLLLAAICFAFFASISDVVIKLIFDQRYHAASWMAPVLIAGTWFSTICSVNESTLLGLGKPNYNAMAYGLKFLWMLIALPLSITHFGAVGAIVVIAVSDVFRYFPVLFGQIRQRFAFALQDFVLTVLVFVLLVFFEWLRSSMGFGTSFDDLPSFG